jgi:hypothetical protein
MFGVQPMYTCQSAGFGAIPAVSLSKSSQSGKVLHATDPPLPLLLLDTDPVLVGVDPFDAVEALEPPGVEPPVDVEPEWLGLVVEPFDPASLDDVSVGLVVDAHAAAPAATPRDTTHAVKARWRSPKRRTSVREGMVRALCHRNAGRALAFG